MERRESCLMIAGRQAAYLLQLQERLEQEKFRVRRAQWTEVLEENLLEPGSFALVIVTDAKKAPIQAAELTERYLTNRGRLIVLGAPAFTDSVFSYPVSGDVRTGSLDQLLEALDRGEFEAQPLLDFSETGILDRFSKDTTNPDSKLYAGNAVLSIEEGRKPGEKCLKWYSPDFYINEHFQIDIAMPEGADALTLCARAGETTRTVTLTLVQQDGQTFRTTFLPETKWKRHLFVARDFRYNGPLPGFRRPEGKPALDFSQVKTIRFGHAVSHAYSCAGEQWFCISEVAAARMPFADAPGTILPGLYPEYKYYPVTNAVRLTAPEGQGILAPDTVYPLPEQPASISMRSQSSGLDKKRRFRFIPLLEALDGQGLHCGYGAYLLRFDNQTDTRDSFTQSLSRFDGAALAVFTPNEDAFYGNAGVEAVCKTAGYLLRGVRLLEAGSSEYAYFSDAVQSTAGAMIVVEDGVSEEALDKIWVRVQGCGIERKICLADLPVVERREGVTLRRWAFDFTACEGCLMTVLEEDGYVFDRIDCEVALYTEKPEAERRFAKVAGDGSCEITIDGRPARFYGVNYMPSGCIGNEDGWYHEYYFSRMAYDPVIIRADLERLVRIGMNAVSVFLYHDDCVNNQNFLHFVSLCRQYGLYIDLGLRPHATPFAFVENEVKDLIGRLRLADCDRIVAYDISWERYNGSYEGSYGNFLGRKSYDPAFRDYLLTRYGSFEAAQREIGFPLPRNDRGEVIGASDEMLREEGPYRNFVAVYRCFVDSYIRRAHWNAARYIRFLDPNHLLTARTGDASTVPLVDPGIYGYDYRCLCPGLDFFSPESYALSENPEILRQCIYTNEYSRFWQPNAVVQWKELGKSIWCGSNFTDNTIGEALQENFYRKFYEKLLQAHTGAVYAWWWGGGYRIGENSDFGILNPDGSDRPVTVFLRAFAKTFLNAPPLPPVESRVATDRSAFSTAFEGCYRSVEQDFFGGWERGERVSFTNAGACHTTEDIDRRKPWYADGMPDSFFLETDVQEEQVCIRLYNPAHCVWERNTALWLLDENRNCLAAVPIRQRVALAEETAVEVPREDYDRATFLTLAADGAPFGEIIRRP